MVLLFYPFRNELVDLLDCEKYISIYDSNEAQILEHRKLYEANVDADYIMELLK